VLGFARQEGVGIPGGGCSSPAKRPAKASVPGVGVAVAAAAVAHPVVAERDSTRGRG